MIIFNALELRPGHSIKCLLLFSLSTSCLQLDVAISIWLSSFSCSSVNFFKKPSSISSSISQRRGPLLENSSSLKSRRFRPIKIGRASAVAGNMAARATIPPLMLWMLKRRSGLTAGAGAVAVALLVMLGVTEGVELLVIAITVPGVVVGTSFRLSGSENIVIP